MRANEPPPRKSVVGSSAWKPISIHLRVFKDSPKSWGFISQRTQRSINFSRSSCFVRLTRVFANSHKLTIQAVHRLVHANEFDEVSLDSSEAAYDHTHPLSQLWNSWRRIGPMNPGRGHQSRVGGCTIRRLRICLAYLSEDGLMSSRHVSSSPLASSRRNR